MTAPNANAARLLRQEILEEAGRQREDILRRAREEAQALVARAQREAEQFRSERMGAARAEAQRRAEAILATVPVAAGRMRLARTEELLHALHDEVRARLLSRAGFDYRETIVRLGADALRYMTGDAFRLRLSVGDHHALKDGLVEAIRECSDRPALQLGLVAEAARKDGEVLLEDDEGRQVWNLSLEARLERCWPELRRQIAAQTTLLEEGHA